MTTERRSKVLKLGGSEEMFVGDELRGGPFS